MTRYMRVKTTTGHRYSVRMAEDEIAEKWTARVLMFMLTFIGSAGMFLLWVKMG